MRRSLLIVGFVTLFAAGPVAFASEGTATAPMAPDLAAALADPDLLEEAIEADLRYRNTFDLDHRRETVEHLYEHPEELSGRGSPVPS